MQEPVRVLIIDRNPTSRRCARLALESLGASVLEQDALGDQLFVQPQLDPWGGAAPDLVLWDLSRADSRERVAVRQTLDLCAGQVPVIPTVLRVEDVPPILQDTLAAPLVRPFTPRQTCAAAAQAQPRLGAAQEPPFPRFIAAEQASMDVALDDPSSHNSGEQAAPSLHEVEDDGLDSRTVAVPSLLRPDVLFARAPEAPSQPYGASPLAQNAAKAKARAALDPFQDSDWDVQGTNPDIDAALALSVLESPSSRAMQALSRPAGAPSSSPSSASHAAPWASSPAPSSSWATPSPPSSAPAASAMPAPPSSRPASPLRQGATTPAPLSRISTPLARPASLRAASPSPSPAPSPAPSAASVEQRRAAFVDVPTQPPLGRGGEEAELLTSQEGDIVEIEDVEPLPAWAQRLAERWPLLSREADDEERARLLAAELSSQGVDAGPYWRLPRVAASTSAQLAELERARAFQADLEALPVLEVLRLVRARDLRGELVLRAQGRSARLALWGDRLVSATLSPPDPALSLPQVLVRFGCLDPAAWERARGQLRARGDLEATEAGRAELQRALLALGLASPDELRDAQTWQSSRVLAWCCRAHEGRATFTLALGAPQAPQHVAPSVGLLLLDLLREGELAPPPLSLSASALLVRNNWATLRLGEHHLDDAEQALLRAAAQGTPWSVVRAALQDARRELTHAEQALQRLVALGLLDVVQG